MNLEPSHNEPVQRRIVQAAVPIEYEKTRWACRAIGYDLVTDWLGVEHGRVWAICSPDKKACLENYIFCANTLEEINAFVAGAKHGATTQFIADKFSDEKVPENAEAIELTQDEKEKYARFERENAKKNAAFIARQPTALLSNILIEIKRGGKGQLVNFNLLFSKTIGDPSNDPRWIAERVVENLLSRQIIEEKEAHHLTSFWVPRFLQRIESGPRPKGEKS